MYDEFSMLYAALFKKPEPYIKVISLLAGKKEGMTRLELIEEGGLEDKVEILRLPPYLSTDTARTQRDRPFYVSWGQ